MITLTILPREWAACTTPRISLPHQFQVTRLECADVDDHIDLGGAVIHGILGFKHFYFWSGGSQRKTDHRANFDR